MNITIWSTNRDKAVERLWLAYGSNIIIVDESPIFNKSEQLIGFRFAIEIKKQSQIVQIKLKEGIYILFFSLDVICFIFIGESQMETLKMVFSTLLTPVIGVSEYINTASISYRKEKQVEYFTKIQNTLPADKQQSNDAISERALTIKEIWKD